MSGAEPEQSRNPLALPPWQYTAEGALRRVGIEIELAGLDLDALAGLVAERLHLEIRAEGRYERVLSGDPAGDWVVELDFHLLKEMGREVRSDELLDEVRSTAENWLHRAAEPLVPLELVTPPLPMDRMDEVENLIDLMRAQGARGSSDNWVNAFGLQLNPELPAMDAQTLTAYMKAWLCLADWMFERAQVDLTRRLTNYIDPFPVDYVRRVVDPAYQPDIDRLIGDYLAANPTRNRALDWLPAFAHLDEKRVRAAVDDPLVKARPALHYRLPNCEIHRPGWGLHTVWRDWLQVERLAADPDRLDACCRAYQRHLAYSGIERWWHNWVRELETEWLRDR